MENDGISDPNPTTSNPSPGYVPLIATISRRGRALLGLLMIVLGVVVLTTWPATGSKERVTGVIRSPHLTPASGRYRGPTWEYDVETSDPARPSVHVAGASHMGGVHDGDQTTITVDAAEPTRSSRPANGPFLAYGALGGGIVLVVTAVAGVPLRRRPVS